MYSGTLRTRDHVRSWIIHILNTRIQIGVHSTEVVLNLEDPLSCTGNVACAEGQAGSCSGPEEGSRTGRQRSQSGLGYERNCHLCE